MIFLGFYIFRKTARRKTAYVGAEERHEGINLGQVSAFTETQAAFSHQEAAGKGCRGEGRAAAGKEGLQRGRVATVKGCSGEDLLQLRAQQGRAAAGKGCSGKSCISVWHAACAL